MRILLTGSKGQLGRCFKDRLPENWELIAADSATLDITDTEAVMNMVKSFQPDAVVNAAAYTAVEKAENERAKAFAVNGSAVHNLAAAARTVKARFIHISTDYVFDGKSKTPYTETAPPDPAGTYGKSKLSGEFLALAANPDSLIIRTAWVFSEYGGNFVKTILNLAASGSEITLADNQTGCPTYAGDLAQAMLDILAMPEFPRGVYHYCGSNPVNRLEFAQHILQTAAGVRPGLAAPALKTDSTELPHLPSYGVLDCSKIRNELGIHAPDWQKPLAEVIAKLNA